MYRCIGKGTTGSDGVAHLTHDCSGDSLEHTGYAGSGKGLVDIVASLDKPIGSGSVVSEPYPVIDAIAYDTGIQGTASDIWQDSNNMITRQSDGTQLTGNQWNDIKLKLNDSTNIPFTDGLCVEFDLVALNGQFRIAFNDGIDHYYTWNSADQYTDIGHWKFIINDGKITRQLDDGTAYEVSAFDNTVSTFVFKFYAYASFQSAKFKEFKMYPI